MHTSAKPAGSAQNLSQLYGALLLLLLLLFPPLLLLLLLLMTPLASPLLLLMVLAVAGCGVVCLAIILYELTARWYGLRTNVTTK